MIFSSLMSYKCIIFDLDNTLYEENLYLFSSYKTIGQLIEKKYNIPSKNIYDFLKTEFLQFGRKKIFNSLIEKYDISENEIHEFLIVLRNHKLSKKLNVFPEMMKLITFLIENEIKICVLTNGNILQQKNKISQIDWKGKEKYIQFFYANEIEPKPSPKGVLYILEKFKLNNQDVIFIGDSEVDMESAINADIEFVNVREFLFN